MIGKMNIDIIQMLQLAIILLVSITVHEFAHAWSSDKLWDPTPRMMGRLTLNPLAHIDPLGFILIFIIRFGWGKPVQVNPSYYRRPLRDELLVAMAWPASNIILACIGIVVVIVLSTSSLMDTSAWLVEFWQLFAIINCSLAVFNMLPLPPLDGWRLVKMFVPQWATKMQYLTYQNTIITFVLLFVGVQFVAPIIGSVSYAVYQWLSTIFFALFMMF